MTVTDWDSQEQSFLVCVYNVSQDQDYTFLQVAMSSTSQDVVTQVSVTSQGVNMASQGVSMTSQGSIT